MNKKNYLLALFGKIILLLVFILSATPVIVRADSCGELDKPDLYGKTPRQKTCIQECERVHKLLPTPKKFYGEEYDNFLAPLKKCRQMCDSEAYEAIKSCETSSSAPITSGEKSYRERYLQKCRSSYNNHPSVERCCSDQAIAGTEVMKKRGVFDTSTTAEMPIFIDESKCKIQEKDLSSDEYVQRCLDLGKFPTFEMTEYGGRKLMCLLSYNNALISKNKKGSGELITPKLSPVEKYINRCIGEGGYDDIKDMEDRAGYCQGEYMRVASNHVRKCLQVNGSPTPQEADYKECRDRFYKAVDDKDPELRKDDSIQPPPPVTPKTPEPKPVSVFGKVRGTISSFLGRMFSR
jgi:hypothetical protein